VSLLEFFLFLAYSLTGFVLADTSLADTDEDKEEDVNDEEEEYVDDEKDGIDDEEEEDDDDEKENKGAIDNMPPKLNQAAVTPSKKNVIKELGVEKLATAVSKKLKISTPACKLFSANMLDG
jgi:hypothetical protein